MKTLQGKIKTKVEVKASLTEWVKDKETFKTEEAAQAIRDKAGKVIVSNQRIAQYLRGSAQEHQFHKGLKKWVRLRL